MAISSLKIRLNREEFSRFEPDRRVLKARILPTPAQAPAETVTVRLLRRDGKAVASRSVAFGGGDYSKGEVVTFDLSMLTDADGFSLVTTGEYTIEAVGVGGASVSAPFIVSLMTVDNLKASYCAGIQLTSHDVISAKKQPQIVTGITIKRASEGTLPGIYALSFTKGVDNNPDTLQWNGGATVEIASNATDEILPDDRGDYIEVEIDPFELPEQSVIEGIVMDGQAISDAAIRQEISRAVAEMERHIGCFLEPKRVATPPYFQAPEAGEFFDVKGQEAAYYRREAFSSSSLAWRINLPYSNVQKVSLIEGYFGTGRSLQLKSGTYGLNEKMGVVDVLPQGADYSYIITFLTQINYWGIREVISDFWRYKIIAGISDSIDKSELFKAIGYSAAIPVLTVAGQQARGGRVSESTSKDGVSRSTSFGSNGVYAATITEYQNWLKENKANLRKQFAVAAMTVL